MSRTLASLALVGGIMLGLAPSPATAQTTQPLVRVVSLVINDLTADGDELIANATVVLNIAGETVTRTLEIPVSLEDLDIITDPTTGGPCVILDLELGPIELNLLGLKVKLDDCDGGPIEVTITAVPGDGNLLGNLLCGVAGLLNGLDLDEVLAVLQGSGSLDAIRRALNLALENLVGQLNGGVVGVQNHKPGHNGGQGRGPDGNGPPGQNRGGQGGPPGQAKRCEILNLEIPQGIHVNLLGLRVDTSGICLNITAQSGNNQLLGNLLCQLVGLLNNGGSLAAIQAKVTEIQNLLALLRG